MVDGHEVAMALRTAYLTMHRQADAAVQPFGVTANQFVVLSVLAEQDGISQRVLVERAGSDPNTIRPILAALERTGYVQREADPHDGRAWCVRLTGSGRSAFERIRHGSDAFRRRLTSNLSEAEARHLVELLGRVVGGLVPDARSRSVKRTVPSKSANWVLDHSGDP